jgi:hypothetical protein
MKPLTTAVLVFVVGLHGFAPTAAKRTQCWPRLAIPRYSELARLSGSEGKVYVEWTVDEQCHITGGPGITGDSAILRDSVQRALGYEVPLFLCDGHAGNLVVTFAFSLAGEPTNEWSPTHVRFRRPSTVEISTRPPDLKSLGLTKIR